VGRQISVKFQGIKSNESQLTGSQVVTCWKTCRSQCVEFFSVLKINQNFYYRT